MCALAINTVRIFESRPSGPIYVVLSRAARERDPGGLTLRDREAHIGAAWCKTTSSARIADKWNERRGVRRERKNGGKKKNAQTAILLMQCPAFSARLYLYAYAAQWPRFGVNFSFVRHSCVRGLFSDGLLSCVVFAARRIM